MEEIEENVNPAPESHIIEEDLLCLRNISDPRILRYILIRRIFHYPFFVSLISRMEYLLKPEFEHLFADNPAGLTVLRIMLNAQFRQFIDAVIGDAGGPLPAEAG